MRNVVINNNNNCLKSNIQCIEIRVQWTVHLGSSHMHVELAAGQCDIYRRPAIFEGKIME